MRKVIAYTIKKTESDLNKFCSFDNILSINQIELVVSSILLIIQGIKNITKSFSGEFNKKDMEVHTVKYHINFQKKEAFGR